MAPLKPVEKDDIEVGKRRYPWLRGHGSIEAVFVLFDEEAVGRIHG